MSRYLHYLRIAFTAFCGVMAVLLLVFWVRSYWRSDLVAAVVSKSTFFTVGSNRGTLTVGKGKNAPGYFNGRWEIEVNVVVNPRARRLEDSPVYRGAFGFGIAQVPTAFFTIGMPYWSFVALAVVLATLPWVRRLPWSTQFSLRTLLLACTAVAVVLGLIVWLAHR